MAVTTNLIITPPVPKRSIFLAGLAFLILLALLAWRWFIPRLPTATPQEMGLDWQECPANGGWISACFDPETYQPDAGERARHGQRIDMQNFRLEIGPDVYWTRSLDFVFMYEIFVLYRNGWPAGVLAGEFGGHSPNIGLDEIGGKPVWEFAWSTMNHRTAVILYDGRDLRRSYGLERAYAPAELNGRLVFVGEKDGEYFIVYDGVRLTPSFDQIVVAYCCEAVLYSPRAGQGKYLFYGTRRGQAAWVQISAAGR